MEWKKFKEEMPERGRRVLVLNDDGDGASSWLICDDGTFLDWQGEEPYLNPMQGYGWNYLPDDYLLWFEREAP